MTGLAILHRAEARLASSTRLYERAIVLRT